MASSPISTSPSGASTAANNATSSTQAATNRRRSYYVQCCGDNPRRRFSFAADNLLDCVLTSGTLLVEKCVLVLGPLLICFALAIISGMAHTFFTIMVPMMQRHWNGSPWQPIVVGGHVVIVIFLLVEIVFNYFMCVMTKNSGPSYDNVVRELADVTGFEYPETPQEVVSFQRDFNSKMMIRMRRRQQREAEDRQQHAQSAASGGGGKATKNGNNNGAVTLDAGGTASTEMTQRKTTAAAKKNRPVVVKMPSPKQVRNWMIMAPDEWGFCQQSNQPKPPRSHYDHVTKTLVLCLDHYCPWMFNAVGYFNYRYFCNFLWFVQLGMMYGVFMAYRPFVNSSSLNYKKQALEFRKTGVWKHIYPFTPINTERTAITLAFMLCLAVGIAVACLGGFHLYLTLTGQTTIEFHGNFVSKQKAKRLGQKYRNPYDLGWRRNLQQVYGFQRPFWLAFLIPSTREPDFLPLPMNGEEGKRKHLRRAKGTSVLPGGDTEEETEKLLPGEAVAAASAATTPSSAEIV